MARKGDCEIYRDTMKYTCETIANNGDFLVVTTAGSGVVLGNTMGQASLVANPSGYKVAGMLSHDVVDTDLTRYKLNIYKNEHKKGDPACLFRKAIVTVDSLKSGDAPTAGDTAYLYNNGQVTKTVSATGGLVATPKVGEFQGKKDENGFICLEIDLPNV